MAAIDDGGMVGRLKMAAGIERAGETRMARKQKLELTWIGKDDRPKLEPRVLIEDEAMGHAAPAPDGSLGLRDNVLIKGDNLLALKALEAEYAGSIECISIDPPYNTGSAFELYDDGIEHSLWLKLISERLNALRRLLTKSGSIWITIDNNELHYLKVVCDEIFGRSNLIGCVVAGLNPKGRQLSRFFAESHEYVLTYARDMEECSVRAVSTDNVNPSDFPKSDEKGSFRYLPLRNTNKKFNPKTRPNLHYPIYGDLQTGRVSSSPFDGAVEINPKFGDLTDAVWRWGRDKLDREGEDIIVRSVRRQGSVVSDVFQKDYMSDGRTKKIPSWWPATEVGSNDEARSEVKSLLTRQDFGTPKPEKLLRRIIDISTRPGDLVLDSFAGSGTTGAVAHKMGRRWIMVELGDHADTHIVPRLNKVIDGEDPGGVTEATGWQGGGGYRYFRLAPSLLNKDEWGQYVISKEFKPEMLAEAVCKLMGFTYAPSQERFWQHGHSTERDFIYVTTQRLTRDALKRLSHEVGEGRTLFVCCRAHDDAKGFDNLTVKKIPQAVLAKCEWGRDDYSLNIQDAPTEPITADDLDEDAEGDTTESTAMEAAE